MENKKKYILSFAFFTVLLIATFYVIFKEVNFTQLITIIKTVNIWYIGLGMIMVIAYLLFQAIYMKIIMKSLKHKISIKSGFVYACAEFYFSAITPSSTGGQPVEVYYMKKDDIPVSASTIAVLLITAVFKLVLVIMGIGMLIFKPSILFGNGTLFTVIFILGMVINLLLILVCLMLMFSQEFVRKIVMGTIRLLAKLRINRHPAETVNKFEKHLEDYAIGMRHVKNNIPMVAKTILLTIVQRTAMFSIAYFVHLSFGLESYTYFDFLAVQVAIAIAIDSLPLPGGVGISEAMLLIIYKKLYLEDMIVPAMLLTRVISYYFCFLLTGIVVATNHFRITRRSDIKQKEELEQ